MPPLSTHELLTQVQALLESEPSDVSPPQKKIKTPPNKLQQQNVALQQEVSELRDQVNTLLTGVNRVRRDLDAVNTLLAVYFHQKPAAEKRLAEQIAGLVKTPLPSK